MNVKVRCQVAQEQIVDMTRREGSADRATDMLNIPPVLRQFLRFKITEVGDMPTPEDHRYVPCAIARGSSRASLVRPL